MAAAALAAAQPLDLQRTIERAVHAHLERETRGLVGKVRIEIDPFELPPAASACTAPEIFTPPGARPIGRVSVGVRCNAPQRSLFYVPARVSLAVQYVAAARAIAAGETLREEHLTVRTGRLEELPAGVVTDPARALGKTLALALGAGEPLREALLRAPPAVHAGERVRLLARGSGFQVTHEGTALAAASPGQPVAVRVPSGQVVTGRVRADGVVEVAF